MNRKLILTIQDNIAKTWQEGKTPTFAYDRVSTQEQAEKGISLEYQNENSHKYAENNNFKIVHFFSAAESAYKEGRVEFNRMLDCALDLNVKDIIFKNTDRLGRNDID